MRVTLAVLLFASIALGQAGSFDRALELQRGGDLEAAFLEYLAVEGGESAAVRLARPEAEAFLALVRSDLDSIPEHRKKLVEADLVLALGEKARALALYREVAAWYAEKGGAAYPVEVESRGALHPFAVGPGSHRDNWLVRRFLALDAWEDAEAELMRIREIHREEAKPRIVKRQMVPGSYDGPGRWFAVSPRGYTGVGLQFSIDLAYFLLRRERPDEALAALMEPLLALDLDQNPNHLPRGRVATAEDLDRYPKRTGRYGHWRPHDGISRKEFLRLAYGAFALAGEEYELVGRVEEGASARNPRLLRVLARLHLLRQDPDAALAAELAYIEESGFEPVAAALRRGAVCEALGRLDRAAEEYETVLRLGISSKPDLPDDDEEPRWRCMAVAWPNPPFATESLRLEVLGRLERIHGARGDLDRSLAALRLRLESAERPYYDTYDQLRSAFRKHRGAEREEVFREWCLSRASKHAKPEGRAAFAWFGGDLPATARALAEHSSGEGLLTEEWRKRFREKGREACRLLLTTVGAVRRDAGARLALLDLEGKIDSREAIAVLEDLLDGVDGTASIAYLHPKYVDGRSSFENRFQAAYRLARLYERHGETRALVELALKVGGGREPFAVSQLESFRNHEPNPVWLYLQATVALALKHAEPEDLPRFEGSAARAQVARRMRKGDPEPKKDIGWSPRIHNLRLLVAHDDVLDLARDDRYLYVGHPWGVAVHEFNGDPVTRIALGEAAKTLAAGDGVLWAGTPRGLFRIRKSPWKVEHIRLDGDLEGKTHDLSDREHQNVRALALDGKELWIALTRTVQVLDTNSLKLRPFDPAELGAGETRIELFVFDGDRVWAWGRNGPLRGYDRERDIWATVPTGRYGATLVGLVDGDLYATVDLGDPLRTRLCRIDPETLEPVPLRFRVGSRRSDENPRAYLGRLDGRPVFGPDTFVLERDGVTLRPLGPRHSPEKAEFERAWPVSDYTHVVPTGPGSGWEERSRLLALPDGTWVVGRRVEYSSGFATLRGGVDYDRFRGEIIPGDGGLVLHRPDGTVRRWPDEVRGDLLPGSPAFFTLREKPSDRVWIGTRRGLVLLDEDLHVLETFDFAEGLCAGSFLCGAVLRDRPVFTAASGVLTEYDPGTGVFTTRFPDELSGTPGLLESMHRSRFGRTRLQRSPWLGGPILEEPPRHRWTEILCGTRGVVVARHGVKKEGRPENYPELPVELEPGQRARRLAEASEKKLVIKDPGTLAGFLDSENPYLRAEALASIPWRKRSQNTDPYLEQIEKSLADPHPRVRATAAFLLTRCDDLRRVVPLFMPLIRDADRFVRSLAVVELCRRGAPPEVESLREVLSGKSLEHPFGAREDRGTLAGPPELWSALAPHLKPEHFALLVEYPKMHDRGEVFEALGASVARHPEEARILLSAYGREAVTTVRRVLGAAGPALLQMLHDALMSEDRVVRSNAARGCGAIGDSSSVPHLVKALDLESGLSRASIVWALGELKAKELIPHLGKLYEEVRNDERRAKAAGYRFSQAYDHTASHYDSIRDLEAIGKDWDELKAAMRPKVLDPRRDEDLLGKSHLLEALGKIGPETCQEFWRMVAAEEDWRGRMAAARWLGEAEGADRDLSVNVLKRLVGDEIGWVRAPAAVGLLLFGERSAEAAILELLRTGPVEHMLEELQRVPDFEHLRFAEKEIERIASDPATDSQVRHRANWLLRKRKE